MDFPTDLNKSTQYHTSRNSFPLGAASERMDRQMDEREWWR